MRNTIILFFIMTAYLFSQGWNSTVTTTINEPNLVKMDLFTNKDGNHIIVQNSNSTNSIKYYLLNSAGTVVRSSTIETSGNAEFPNISGDNDKVYLVYKLGSNLKAKKSTDAGQNWTPIENKAIGSNTCNGVDVVYDFNGLHVVYAMKDSDPYYETYYYKLNSSNNWVDYKNVTDHSSGQYGGFPTVTVSDNRVHVSFNTGTSSDPTLNQGEAKTRDKYTDTWQTPQLVFGGSDGTSGSERAFSDNTSLFDFYYKFIEGMGQWHFDLYVKTRPVGGTNWSSATLIEYYAHPGKLISPVKTNDGKIQIIYLAGSPSTIYHKSFNGSSWSSSYSVASISSGYLNAHSLSSVSNDLFVTFKESTSNNVKYRQYDAVPLAPQNLTVSAYNGKPRLQWTANNEPDINVYKIYKKKDSPNYSYYASTSSLSYVDEAETMLTGPHQANETVAHYKITAVDLGSHESEYSNEVSARVPGQHQEKISYADEYELAQNYPNPFNPSTKISWQSPVGSLQTVKVYDVLGNEVATLVNEYKEAGYYEVDFDASNLPSGVYIYKLQAGSFTAVKKMILAR